MKHPEGLGLDLLDIPKTACVLFVFDETDFRAQVRQRFCRMVPPQ